MSLKKPMPKLRDGMFGLLDDGDLFVVVGDLFVYQSGLFSERSRYDQDGFCDMGGHKIMKLFNCKCFNECDEFHCIWTREEKKQYTYAQLKEILGEEFEIVRE